jgi:hypothetical protein
VRIESNTLGLRTCCGWVFDHSRDPDRHLKPSHRELRFSIWHSGFWYSFDLGHSGFVIIISPAK